MRFRAVILAGGSGERFWPLSTKGVPKQFLDLDGNGTLLRQTYERLSERFDDGDIVVVTHRDYGARTKEELPELPPMNVVCEPVKRNTGPACALAALLSGDSIDFVVPADHHMKGTSELWKAVDAAKAAVVGFDSLLTFGIGPTRAETGFGYIETGKEVSSGLFKVKRFREKPDPRTAERFASSGRHLWNSGMFMWRTSTFLSELGRCAPDVLGPLQGADLKSKRSLKKAYGMLPSISIDYAVMERSKNVMTVRSNMKWSDVGSWSSVRELRGYTAPSKKSVLVGSSRAMIMSSGERPVAIVGLEDVIVVDSPEGLLVCSEKDSQRVREVRKVLDQPEEQPKGRRKK